MISNHYAMTYGHSLNWLILIVITLIGALIRVYFVARHKGKASLTPIFAAAALLVGIIILMAPSKPTQSASADTVSINTVHKIVTDRCSSCHASAPTQAGFAAAPKGIVFDSEEDTVRQAAIIHQQAVVTRAMPIGNLTRITEEERNVLDQWFRQNSRPQE